MKYILLILATIIVYSKLESIKTIFKSDKARKEDIAKSFNKVEDQFGKEDARNIVFFITFVLMIIISLVYLCLYILSMIYVQYWWFAIVSIMQILFTIRILLKSMSEINNFDNPDYCKKPRRVRALLNILFEFAYIGYLLHFIIVNWG